MNTPFPPPSEFDLASRRSWREGFVAVGLAVLLLTAMAVLYFRRGGRQRPELLALSPQPDTPLWSRLDPLTLSLSAAADQATVQQAVRFTPAVGGRWRASDDGRVWHFTPAPPGWPRHQSVRLTVGPPLADPPQTFTFRVRPVLLAYLWPHAGPAQVYALDPAAPQSHRALTRSPTPVLSFAVEPHGRAVVYSAANEQGGADLWWRSLPAGQARVLVACETALCDQPRWAPDGRLAFQREPRQGPRQVLVGDPQAARWTEVPAQGDAYGPLWSAQAMLAYYDQGVSAYRLWHAPEGVVAQVPNATGEHAAWAADGQAFFHVELLEVPDQVPDIPDPRLSAHLLRYDLATGRTTDLTRAWHWEDASPAPDPTGRYLAFARKDLRPEAWAPGRQLWLYDLEAGRARALTHAPAYNHLGFTWEPNGARLAYVRTPQLALSAAPELWLYTPATDTHTLLREGAYAPQWLP